MFSNLNIDIAQLESQLPDLDDARSMVTTKSLRGMNLSKKDKRKVKHEFLMKSKWANNNQRPIWLKIFQK